MGLCVVEYLEDDGMLHFIYSGTRGEEWGDHQLWDVPAANHGQQSHPKISTGGSMHVTGR